MGFCIFVTEQNGTNLSPEKVRMLKKENFGAYLHDWHTQDGSTDMDGRSYVMFGSRRFRELFEDLTDYDFGKQKGPIKDVAELRGIAMDAYFEKKRDYEDSDGYYETERREYKMLKEFLRLLDVVQKEKLALLPTGGGG
jgi:hypothetical protein